MCMCIGEGGGLCRDELGKIRSLLPIDSAV